MADRLPQEHVHVFINRACPVCLEDLAGPTTRAAAGLGRTFREIFYQSRPTRSRAWGGLVLQFVHRCHLN